MTIDNVFPNCLGWAQMCQALQSHCVWTMTFYVLCLRCKRFELELQLQNIFLSVNILAIKLAIVALTYKRYACSVSSIYYIICLHPDIQTHLTASTSLYMLIKCLAFSPCLMSL